MPEAKRSPFPEVPFSEPRRSALARAKQLYAQPEGPVVECTPEQWSVLVGCLADGSPVITAIEAAGVPRAAVEGILRTDPARLQQWDDAKLLALRRDWDIETVEEILSEIATNQYTVQQACANRGKSYQTFLKLILKDEVVAKMFEEAQKLKAIHFNDENISISDDDGNDTTLEGGGNMAAVKRAELRIRTRQFGMAAWHRKVFSPKEKQELKVDININHAERLESARQRRDKRFVASRAEREGAITAEVVKPSAQAQEPAPPADDDWLKV